MFDVFHHSHHIESPRMLIVRFPHLFLLDFGGLLVFSLSVPVGVELREFSVLSSCSHTFLGSYVLDVYSD